MKCALVWRSALNSGRSVWAVLASRKRWAALGSDERGSVAIIFGLTIFVLFAMIGLAVDYARFVNARSQTIAATDAAVLAGARALQSNGGDQAAAVQVAETYYQQGVKSRIKVVPLSDNINFFVSDNGTAMSTTGNARISTPFMHLAFGLGGTESSTLPLLRADGSDYSKAVLAVGGNGEQSLEVSLMLDITGSMAGQKLTDMKAAASDLVNIVVWQDQSQYTSKIAIVPFAYDVRPPSSILKNIRGVGSSTNTTQKISGTTYNLSDCVVERAGSEAYTDTAPGAGKYLMGHYVKKTNNKVNCDVPAAAELLPLTSDKSALLTKISNLSTAGSTAGHLGTAWAWYLLSPNWGSLWSSTSRPAAYGTEKLKKIAVLMTDGEYNTQYTSQGIPDGSSSLTKCPNAANGVCSSAQAVSLCKGMKAKGIEVYTVGFQLDNQTAVDTLSTCATDANHFYNSSTGDALKAAFRDIALKISTLYLSQ
ncbi:pilus assembly protein [Hyphomicrobium sp. MC1]|uniref:TadE/TadG family type IV pilus assembly protein n=1 Tax=Hyphomicrobium sp. (strain MC1) TaxID=717785 RepID=UPI000213DA61|nr:pilus assembly protein [Hyphomicrobium sp. MC1]CCB63795.1 von Willebrand factor type A [Hyphomicrobium sp. MC1]